jgi:DNA-binding GntR family transcriptional regulator
MMSGKTPPQQGDNVNVIYSALKKEILNLMIPPGAVISEAEICDRFSVSRTPVRSAFLRLQDRGFIKIVPYKETRVTLINLHQIKQMIYMRIALETKTVRDFIDRWDPLWVEKLRYYLRRQLVMMEGSFVPHDFYVEDSAFHRIWFDRIDMRFLWCKIQHAQVHYTRFRMLDIVEVHDFHGIIREHERLFSIIENKEKDEVEPFFEYHLNGGLRRLGDKIYREYADYFKPDEKGGPEFLTRG